MTDMAHAPYVATDPLVVRTKRRTVNLIWGGRHRAARPLVVGILVDEGTFHVAAPVAPGASVSILNTEDEPQTVTAQDGSFDLQAPAYALFSFTAPAEPGQYPFRSTLDGSYQGLLVVQQP